MVKQLILRKQRSAEKLIEEFMLAANETVAEAMTWLNVPFIYRVHEEPSDEKITKLLETLDLFGYNVKIKNKKAVAPKGTTAKIRVRYYSWESAFLKSES